MTLASISQTDWGNEMLVRLQPLWKEAILCDTTIECKQKSIIQAHSILLAAASPKLFSYFRAAEQGSYTLVTPDVPVSVWRNILNFIYQGRIDIGEDELVSTFNFARRIEMQDFCVHLGKEIETRGLALEQQEAFLRACASQSPRGNHVTSPVGVMAPSRTPTSLSVSSLSPRLLAASPQLQSPPLPGSSKSPLGRQLSSPHSSGATTQPSPSLVPTSASFPGPAISITPLPPNMSQALGLQPVHQTIPVALASSKASSAPTTPQNTTPSTSSSSAASSKPHPLAQSRSPKPATTTPTLQPQAATSINIRQPRERYECDACLQNFNRESALRKHQIDCKKIQDPTTPQQPTPAPARNAVVSYKNFYTRIKETEGKETAKFKCGLCEKTYQAYQGLYVHLKTKHANETQAIAQPATRHFRPGQLMTSKGVNSASESRLLNRSTSCPICKKQFKNYANMLAHKKTHTPQPTTRRSSTSSDLSFPATETTSGGVDGEDAKYVCANCGSAFKMKMHLTNHIRKHHE